ncbi:MAG: hypothetical protein C4313_08725, partial [Thermoflexus sp.]
EAQRRHYEEFVAFRAEAERRFAALQEEVAAARAEADRRFAELAEAQRRHYEEFETFRAEVDRRFAQLIEAHQYLLERVNRLDRRAEQHAQDLGRLKKFYTETRYRERAATLFRPLLRRARAVPDAQIEESLEEAVAAGRITPEEADDAARLDLVVEGFHRREDRRLYLAVEISWLGTPEDVGRALQRAEILTRALNTEVWPAVAADRLTWAARRMARALQVWWVHDHRIYPPGEIPEPEEKPEEETEQP